MIKAKLLRAALPYVIAAAVIISALWGAYAFGVDTENANRRAEVAELVREHEQTLAAINKQHAEALAQELRRRLDVEAKAAADMAALDARFTKEINDAKSRSDHDIAAVRAGEYRLRDRFTCPAAGDTAGPGGGAGEATRPTGLGDGRTPRGFGPEDAAAVIAAADEGDRWAVQLRACQAIVRRDRAK